MVKQSKSNKIKKKLIPPENLLVWQPSDGWEPLCKFLEVEIPPTPIPVENQTSDIKYFQRFFGDRLSDGFIRNMIGRQVGVMLIVGGVFATLSYKAFRLIRKADFPALLTKRS